jgi:hypothetical protein
MDAVLVKDEWMDYFYQMNIWVKDPCGDAEYCLNENDIRMIIPELIKNNKIQYHKISLINLLKLRDVEERLIVLEHNKYIMERQIGYMMFVMILFISFSILERLRLCLE